MKPTTKERSLFGHGDTCPACHAGGLVMDLDDFGRCDSCGADWFRARAGDDWQTPSTYFNVKLPTKGKRRGRE